jgi:hypothetical protein
VDNEAMNIMIWGSVVAVAIFALAVALSPLVKLLDRISAVVDGLEPSPDSLQTLKIYWYLARNQDVLKDIEEKNAKGEKAQFILPVGNEDDDEILPH